MNPTWDLQSSNGLGRMDLAGLLYSPCLKAGLAAGLDKVAQDLPW